METNVNYIDITSISEEILSANQGLSNAIANDGMDDSIAIQAAVDWLTAQRAEGFVEEAVIYIPEGVYDLDETIKVDTPNIAFRGDGAGATVLQNSDGFQVGTEGLPDSGLNAASANRSAYLFDLHENADSVAFADIALTGSDIHGAIFGFRSDDLEIRNAEFNNFAWSSVRLYNASGASIHDNLFVDAGGQANGDSGVTGGSIYATYLEDSEIYNNRIDKSGNREGNVYGIKGRDFRNTRIHHNTINTNFAIELPFENDQFVEIDHNFLDGVVSVPKFGGGPVPDDGFTFHIHHNYFTRSYSLEWARSGAEINNNVFAFDVDRDHGNLISSFGSEPAEGPTKFHNNLIINPGRGIFWSRGVYDGFSFYNNHVIANETITSRVDGLFGFHSQTDFNTIEIKDNLIQVNGTSRPLMRNDASYSAVIENNELINISDVDSFSNPDMASPSGLLEPLLFQVGADGELAVDSDEIIASMSTQISPAETNMLASRPTEVIRVEAEDYKAGTNGDEYYDASQYNIGGAYRPDEPVDLQATGDVGGGFNVGWVSAGEYLSYDVDIAQAGSYDVVARVATPKNGKKQLGVSFDGQPQEVLEFGRTGGWQEWQSITVGEVDLSAGSHELRLNFLTGELNLNYIALVPS